MRPRGAFAERLCGLEQRRDAQPPAHEQIVGVHTDVERLAQRPEHIHMVAGRERERRDAQPPAHEQIVGVHTDVERLAQRPEHIHMVAGRERGEFLGAITDDGEDETHLDSVHLAHAERARHEMLRVVRI